MRRTHGGIGHGARGEAPRTRRHGGEHGGYIPRDGPCFPGGSTVPGGGSGRSDLPQQGSTVADGVRRRHDPLPRRTMGRAHEVVVSAMPSSRRELKSSWFQRIVLPGLAFKAVVIGGGYATGRELVEFFLPSGPRGGLAGMVLAMLIWSVVCATTFRLARLWRSLDYRAFFDRLLGKFWPLFDIAYLVCTVLVLSVFGAAAGEIGAAV